ncbi:hypothetical protein [Streptomyces hirsutus]|uniref:hypothetical protein n=1 Tax=Streptomyces hirsutus TaxID=35620 RepID=UPI003651C90E
MKLVNISPGGDGRTPPEALSVLGLWHTFRRAITESKTSPRSASGSATLVPKPAWRRSGANQEYDACGQEREPEGGEKPTPDPYEPPLAWGAAEEVHPWMLRSQSVEGLQEAGVGVGRIEKPYLNRSWNVQVEQVSRRGDLLAIGA